MVCLGWEVGNTSNEFLQNPLLWTGDYALVHQRSMEYLGVGYYQLVA